MIEPNTHHIILQGLAKELGFKCSIWSTEEQVYTWITEEQVFIYCLIQNDQLIINDYFLTATSDEDRNENLNVPVWHCPVEGMNRSCDQILFDLNNPNLLQQIKNQITTIINNTQIARKTNNSCQTPTPTT